MMGIKQQIYKHMPAFVKRIYGLGSLRREIKELAAHPRLACDVNNLRLITEIGTKLFSESPDVEQLWNESKKTIDEFVIPEGTCGVNPGDRRAIYYLISKLKPSSVLEIGTHIGASTLHIASAIHANQMVDGKIAHLVSVDIIDVNDPVAKPWLKYGTKNSPREVIDKLKYGAFVEFVADTSLNYAARCERKFDFIFLDGDHRAQAVYREIPVALSMLNKNGVILLHDYFPQLKPLWSNNYIIPGPYLATERLEQAGANIRVLPFGKLPWPTKLQSNVTSLALLLRKE